MSGSIGGNRIPRSAVQGTLDRYIENVLSKFDGYRNAKISGSYNAGLKKDHGDIDLVVYIEGKGKELKQVKKDFKAFLESLPDDITVPFPSGRNTGKKAQLYGNIVTCLVPMDRFEGLSVQVDNIIVLSEQDQEYQKSFLDLPAEKQALIQGLSRVILTIEKPEEVFARMGINPKKLPTLDKNQEFEFALGPSTLTLRKVTYGDDFKEQSREILWTSRDWKDILKLFKNFDLGEDYDHLLGQVASKVPDSRSRNRIIGVMKSMINVGPGEQGTPKGDGKLRAIEAVNRTLSEIEESDNVETVALYGGGFKPPHKAHFANAQKLADKADKLIVFIGPKVREGVPITAEQSKKVWEIYKRYINKPVEIRVSEKTPISDIYNLIANPDLSEIKFLVGKSVGADEDKKFAYLVKNKDKYPNVKLITLPVIADKEDSKFSATTLRKSIEIIKKGEWIPAEINRDDARKILDILIGPLEQKALQEEIGKGIQNVLDECRGKKLVEGSSGTPIGLVSVTSSESREELANLYWKLQDCLPENVEAKFNQSFIVIICPSDKEASNIYSNLFAEYSEQYNVGLESGSRVIIRPLRKSNSKQQDADGLCRTDAYNRQQVNESEDQILDKDMWVKHAAGLISYMRKNGLGLDPLPDIVLDSKEQQPGLLAKTAEYDPVDKIITVYTKGRAFKDSLRSLSHELIHCQQDLDGKVSNVQSERISDNDQNLNDLEREAYEKGNMLFRGYTETLQLQEVRKKKKDFREQHEIREVEAGLGFSEKEQKWYGWSHRAYHGFGIGDKPKEIYPTGTKTGKVIKTLEQAKEAAKRFSESVS